MEGRFQGIGKSAAIVDKKSFQRLSDKRWKLWFW